MKRYTRFITLFLLCFLSLGCSNKLICKKDNYNKKETIEITFKDDYPNFMKWNKDTTYNEDDALIELDYLEQKNYLDSFNETKGLTYDIKMNDRKGFIKENIVIDFKKYDKSSQFKLPIVLEDKKTNEYYLKNNGYICK